MLPLNGVSQSLRCIQTHFYENRECYAPTNCDDISICPALPHKEKNFFNQEILGRLSFIQITLIAIDTLVTQFILGIVHLVGGVITLNGRSIKEGAQHFLSIPVQLIALPCIALISLLHPKSAEKLGLKIMEYGDWGKSRLQPANPAKVNQYIVGKALAILSIPVSMLRSALRVPIYLLSGEFMSALCAIICIIKEPIASIGRIFTQPYTAHEAEYSAEAFENIANKGLWFLRGI